MDELNQPQSAEGLPPGARVRYYGPSTSAAKPSLSLDKPIVTPKQPAQPQGVTGLPEGAQVRYYNQPVQTPDAEDETGVSGSLHRTGKNLLEMIPSFVKAFNGKIANDDEDKAVKGMRALNPATPDRVLLGLHRLIGAPMQAEADKSEAMQKLAHELRMQHLTDEQKKNVYDNPELMNEPGYDWKQHTEDYKSHVPAHWWQYIYGPEGIIDFGGKQDSPEHLANMHKIASVVPAVGPMSSEIAQRAMKGDVSGAATDVVSNIALGKVMEKTGGAAVKKVLDKVGPQVRDVAGVKVPVLASQTGSKAGAAAETATKVIGKTGENELTKFTGAQAEKGNEVVSKIAGEQAAKAGEKLDSTVNPLSMSADDFAKLTSSKAALAKSADFGEAAKNLKAAAGDHFKMIDEATDGKFSELKAERSAAYDELRKPGSDSVAVKQKLADIAKREDDMFAEHGMDEGKTSLAAARDAWKRASAMEELDSRLKRVTSSMLGEGGIDAPLKSQIKGAGLLKQLNEMDPETLKLAVGDTGHVQSLRTLGAMLQSGQNVAKMSTALKFLRASRIFGAYHHPLAIASTEGLSYVMGKVLTDPKMAQQLANGLKVGASAPVIANAIAQHAQPQPQEEEK